MRGQRKEEILQETFCPTDQYRSVGAVGAGTQSAPSPCLPDEVVPFALATQLFLVPSRLPFLSFHSFSLFISPDTNSLSRFLDFERVTSHRLTELGAVISLVSVFGIMETWKQLKRFWFLFVPPE